jgi:DivIVA domain-containing protein
MPLTPQDVVRKEFREAFRGYNQADVDLFLDEVVDEMTRLVDEGQRMKVKITALQQELARYRPAEGAPPAETSEARWRLRRFLEEQGRPLDEIEKMPRSATVERIAREAPRAQDDDHEPLPPRGEMPTREPARPREDAAVDPRPSAPSAPPTDEREAIPEPPERDRDTKPFWAAE